ncbi:T9SS type B sorting domain-containing protein [uncultured Psychroserpens sp.]|uniref:T9SS type B sorting domain-containing protein n=1 Tax=uncultured Psychroserpens sp. TaxID=255436 RepID=UPI00262AC8A1|nr:choice-of-anchor L domain-containing protein [uncultured Psychroserpens sp.]
MKRFLHCPIFIVINLFYFANAQQVTINNSFNAQQLVQDNLVEGCVELTNITSSVNGNINGFASYGDFERGNSDFPFENGIVLSTGNVFSGGNVPNGQILNEGETNWGTDPDLEAALGVSNLLNATSIEFDFISITNQIQFNYILASEEYFGNFPCLYSDGFAFLIKRAGTTDPYQNIALVPGTTIPVNTSTVHDEIVGFCQAENPEYFDGYNVGDTNFNGRTEVLTATAVLIPNVQYHIKLVIADQTDENYDSAVFIEGKSFNAVVDLGEDITTCASDITLDADVQNSTGTYSWYYNGTEILGETSPTLNVSQSGNYTVVVQIPVSGTLCPIEDSVNVSLSATQPADVIIDYELCDAMNADGIEQFDLTFHDNEVLNAVPNGSYTISYHYSNNDAINNVNPISGPINNTSNPQTIYVRIVDVDNGCLAYSNFDLIVNPLPVLTQPTDIEQCDDADSDGITAIDLTQKDTEIINGQPNLVISYHYTQADANSGNNPIPSPYVNTNPVEQLFVRAINTATGCVSTTTLIIRVYPNPDINLDPIYLDACDQDQDGFATFDLTSIIGDVLNGLTGVTVTFHETYDDALLGVNAITDPANYVNIVLNMQTIYIRVEDDVSGCFTIRPFEIHTNLLLTGTAIQDFALCDVDNDGSEAFDLNYIEGVIVNGLPGVSIEFYLTANDRDNNINPINKAIPFIPSTTPQTLYITLISADCTEVSEIELSLDPVDSFTPIGPIDYCDTDQDGYTVIDLTEFNSNITNGQLGYTVTYHETQTDAENGTNPLPDFYTNVNNPQTIYVRVSSDTTNCGSVNDFEITVIPAPFTTTPNDIYICDDDMDAVSTVDLDAVVPQLVGDPTDLNITFHTSLLNAEINANAIQNTASYITGTQTLYARIESAITSCFSTEEFTVTVSTLPVLSQISNFRNCNAANNGIGSFIFNTKDNEILNGQNDKDVLYFTSQTDADNRTNSIDKNNPYQNISNPQTIFVRIENIVDENCFLTSSFELEVGNTPEFNVPDNIFVCDDVSNDGQEFFDLSAKITEIEQGIPDNLNITFHTSLDAAQNDNAPLPLQYLNTSNPQQLYVRIENGTYCYSITEFEVNVIQVPEVNATTVTLTECDVDYDGIVNFDLTESEFEILDVRLDNIFISYHESFEDAEQNTNIISDPENYLNTSNPQTVYIKINNVVSNCYVIIPITLIVNLPPEINDFGSVEICDNDTNSYNLGQINSIITDNNIDVVFSYHATLADAQNDVNPLNTDYTYITNNDIIHARLEYETTQCFTTYSFELIVNENPIANMPPDLHDCDDISNDANGEFDLSIQTPIILGNQNAIDFTVTYHATQTSAADGTNPLDEVIDLEHQQLIHVRVENNTTGCYSLTSFGIVIHPYPVLNEPLVECDINYDEITTMDLTQKEALIAASTTGGLVFTYFESEADLLDNTSVIANPTLYTNYENPQTIFIKVYNQTADCFSIVPMEVIINLPPVLNDLDTIEICDNNTNSLLLSNISNLLVDDTAGILFSYFTTLNDAQNDTNSLTNNYTYTSNSDTLFVKVKYAATQCEIIHEFQIIVNDNPVLDPPPSLEICDDASNDQTEIIDLSIHDINVLGNLDAANYNVSYYYDAASAITSTNPISNEISVTHNQTIYARAEHNTFSCFDVVSFTIIIHPKVNSVPEIIVCDEDYDGLTSSNLTIFEADMLAQTTGTNVFTYFESIADLEDNSNQIATPNNYSNYENPQTVYIKVDNLSANCYSVVPLDIIVNLPPEINTISAVEICDNDTNTILLNEVTTQLVDDLTDILVSYYLTQTDAENNTNSLGTNYAYTSLNETIYAKVKYASTQCEIIYPFELIINENPVLSTPPNMEFCDDVSNNQTETIDLSNHDAIVLDGLNASEYEVSYHIDNSSAISGTNALDNSTSVIHDQIIYARVTHISTGCYSVTNFGITIHPHASALQELVVCDNDYDGLTTFDLTVFEAQMDLELTGTNSYTYFESIADLEDDTNQISAPETYNNFQNPQTVYIKVNNTSANCYSSVPLDIFVNIPPIINDIEIVEICDNNTNSILLNEVTAQLIDDDTDTLISYYLSEQDAINNINSLGTNYNYQSNSEILYVKAKFATTQCEIIYPFELIIYENPIANEAPTLEDCDDDQDNVGVFNLGDQTDFVLGNQDPQNLQVTYHSSFDDADNGLNNLNEIHTAENEDIIYVRVENVFTGCYAISDFLILVHPPRSLANIVDQVICLEDLPLVVSAESGNSNDTYLWSTGETTPEITITEVGTYSVTITTPFGCTSTAVFSVTESEQAIIEFTEVIDFSDPNNVTVTVSGIGDYVYILDDGEPQISNVFTNVPLGYHTITIRDVNGCAEVTKEILVIDIPKFFTPNNDGYFDTWHIVGVETLPGTIVHVFDRFGKQLDRLTADSDGWNGTYNGKLLPASDYWFVADVKRDNIEFQVKGHFTLRR